MKIITLDDYIEVNRRTFEVHTDVIFIKDTNLKYRYMNPEFEKISSYGADVLMGRSLSEIRKGEFSEAAENVDRKVIQNKKPITYARKLEESEVKHMHYLFTKTPIIDNNQEIIGLLISARNIDEQVSVKDELHRNIKLIEILLDAMPYPIFIKDTEGVYVKINNAYALNAETSSPQIVGKNDIELYGEKLGKFYRERDLKVMRERERDVYISNAISKDMKYVTTKDVLVDNEDHVIGVVGIVNTFQELSHIRDDLMNIQRIESVSQLAGGIAHDLNNILTNVVALSSMLLYVEEDEQKRGDLESINSSARKAAELMNKLRTFAKKTELHMDKVDFNEIVQDTMQLVSGKYRKKYNIVENYCEEGCIIIGDKSQLSQMVMNLVINAFEAMEYGKTLILSTYLETISSEDDTLMVQPPNFTGGEYLCLKVEDEGSGIDPNIMNQIFEPYFTSKGEEGTGLGLSIVYGVLTAHKGVLSIESTVGKGTKFYIYLPFSNSTGEEDSS